MFAYASSKSYCKHADDGSAEIQMLAIDATPPGQAQPDITNGELVYRRR